MNRFLAQDGGIIPFTTSTGSQSSDFHTLRLNGLWIHRIDGGGNLRVSASLGQSEWQNQSLRTNTGGNQTAGGATTVQSQQSQQHDDTFNLNIKLSKLIANEHSLVTGFEAESNRRAETATTLQNGQSPLSDFDDNLSASTLRYAALRAGRMVGDAELGRARRAADGGHHHQRQRQRQRAPMSATTAAW